VVEVRLLADANLKADDFKTEIVQLAQEPLDQVKVAASLKNLYATGRFLEIAADVTAEGSGVMLAFRAKARYFAGMVRVQGAPKGIDPAALASASGIRLGEPISQELLTRARERISSALESSAYYQGQIEVSQDRHPDSGEADLIFTLTAGIAAHLRRVNFTGEPGIASAVLIREARWRAGMQLTSARLERGLSRLHALYVGRGHLQASISVEKRTYDPQSRTETIEVRVEPGPDIRIHISGARISASALRAILPAYRLASADELTLLNGEQPLRDYFQQKGYFQARVNLVQHTAPDLKKNVNITYAVDLGPRGTFAGYRFQGNHLVASGALAEAVALQLPNRLQSGRGRFDTDSIERSVDALVNLYQARGFAGAKVTPALEENYQGQAHQLFVTFRIDEGVQTRVRKLTLTGLGENDQKRIGSSMLTLPGQPYSPERAHADRDSILTYLANQGYAQATVDWHASEPTAKHEVDLVYQVNAGARQSIKRVVLLGNEFTRRSVVARRLTIAEGQPLNQSALLESQQRLYDLGLFNQVQVSAQDPGSPETGKTVLVGLEEAKRWTLGYGGGLDVQRLPGNNAQGQYGVSPRVALEVDRINLGGRPQTYTLQGHYSNLEKVGSTSYTIPNLHGHPGLDLRITGIADQSRNVLTFDSKREEIEIALQKRYSLHSSLLGRYNFRHVSVSNLQINPASVPLLSQSVLVATLGGSYVNDHRDNPVDASRGSYSTLDADVAWTGLGSSADFGRIITQNSTYYRLGTHLIFARNTRFGVEPTFGQSSSATGATGINQILQSVPLPERLFMGGPDSDRGFSLNEAGPRDPITGYPLGGRALFLNQVELRFPLEQSLGLVLFEDAGNAFSTVRVMRLLKFSQSSPEDFDYDVQAAGLGLRYRTPVGPLRFDVAYSPNIPRYGACLNTTVPVCPAGQMEVLRLPRFQFVLSVGQSF
jgi:outer membrane protein insertion porin family